MKAIHLLNWCHNKSTNPQQFSKEMWFLSAFFWFFSRLFSNISREMCIFFYTHNPFLLQLILGAIQIPYTTAQLILFLCIFGAFVRNQNIQLNVNRIITWETLFKRRIRVNIVDVCCSLIFIEINKYHPYWHCKKKRKLKVLYSRPWSIRSAEQSVWEDVSA